MIIKYEDLKKYRRKLTMVDGCFDPLHKGHIEYFKAAYQLGLPVFCNIASDQYVSRKHDPFLSEDQRVAILDSIRYISFVHINHTSTADVLRQIQPAYYVKGKDWQQRLPIEQVNICKELSIKIIYSDTVLDSSVEILNKYVYNKNSNFSDEVESFEKFIFEQKPIPCSYYDQEYFTMKWRLDGNDYSLETRREIEGKNPMLIKEAFHPKCVLDMGCGPGILMYLLYELGIVADGIDYSPISKELAPPEVRDRIIIGSITEQLVADNSYDLVICRETLEHLTVLQIRQAISNICRVTNKYVYITTRLHPGPESLLAVTNQPEADSTHITLLNKDFLRALFLLEGCRSRPDLEAKMDWLKKVRVLVFEKILNM